MQDVFALSQRNMMDYDDSVTKWADMSRSVAADSTGIAALGLKLGATATCRLVAVRRACRTFEH